jgi:hypothetical protein
VLLKATINNNRFMMHGASNNLNNRARASGKSPIYLKGRRKNNDGTYSKRQHQNEKFYPSDKTVLSRIKNDYEIFDGILRRRIHRGEHVTPLVKHIDQIMNRATCKGHIEFENNITGLTAAFDYTDQDYWGRPNPYVVNTYAEGTTKAYRFGTIRIVCRGAEYCLSPFITHTRKHIELDVKKAIEQIRTIQLPTGKPTRTLMLDREFFQAKCINAFNGTGVNYVMPAKENLAAYMKQRIKRTPADHVSIHPYRMKSGNIGSAATSLVVVPPILQSPAQRKSRAKKRTYSLVFATNIQPDKRWSQTEIDEFGQTLSRVYRLRFGIETDWSILKTLRPRTTSQNPVIRLFYFCMSVLIYNAWVYARRLHSALQTLIAQDFLDFYVCEVNYLPAKNVPKSDDNG